VAYVLCLQELQEALARQQLAAILASAMGGQVEDIPDPATARDLLDEMLAAPLPKAPTLADRKQLALMDALGLERR
jgi:hypothetical protein